MTTKAVTQLAINYIEPSYKNGILTNLGDLFWVIVESYLEAGGWEPAEDDHYWQHIKDKTAVQCLAGMCYAKNVYIRSQYGQATREDFLSRAEAAQNPLVAARLFREAANFGCAEAENKANMKMGQYYENIGDYKSARKWYKKVMDDTADSANQEYQTRESRGQYDGRQSDSFGYRQA